MIQAQNAINDLLRKLSKEMDNHVASIVRKNVTPPIKGEITSGKLRWRGVKLTVQRDSMFSTTYRVTQRGVQVGESILIEGSFDIPTTLAQSPHPKPESGRYTPPSTPPPDSDC